MVLISNAMAVAITINQALVEKLLIL